MTTQMTRAEYEAKYGTAPALPPVASPTVSAPVVKPTSTTVKMTRAEYEAKYKEAPVIPTETKPEEKSTLSKVGEFLAPTVTGAFGKISKGEKLTGRDIVGSALEVGSFLLPVGAVSRGAGLAAKGVGLAVKGLGKRTIEGAAVGALGGGLAGSGRAVGEGEDAAGIAKATAAGVGAGGFLGGAIPGVVAGVGALQRGAKATIPKVAEMVRPVTDIVSDIGGGIARTPKRIATNIAERQGEVQVIKSLPTIKAREAAFNGIDIPDVKTVLNINKEVKPAARELVDNVIKFAKKETSQDPITSVGKPIVAKLRELESNKNIVGGKLEVAARNIGIVTKQELQTSVFNRIQKVKGLEGLGINSKGKLDFSKTTLASDFSRADRNAIQTAYNQSIKWGDGYKAHLFRQELFSVLGGKKRAFGTVLTDTQEKGLDAIRAGLSDVLETKSTGYKELSNQYREIIQPLSAINKKLKAISGTPENALEMNAGLLARRLTSTSMSQGELETILTAMDKATGAKGTFFKNTKELQNIYNVLDRYYQIIPQTGFKGQSQAAFEGAQGLGDLVVKTARGLAGQTPAVRQKALEDLLNEVLAGAKKTNFGR